MANVKVYEIEPGILCIQWPEEFKFSDVDRAVIEIASALRRAPARVAVINDATKIKWSQVLSKEMRDKFSTLTEREHELLSSKLAIWCHCTPSAFVRSFAYLVSFVTKISWKQEMAEDMQTALMLCRRELQRIAKNGYT